MKTFLLLILLFVVHQAYAQVEKKEHVLQISGVVLIGDSLYPAPYVGVVRLRDQRGTYCDRGGYFTLPALAGDTLEFFNLGLKNSFFIIPSSTLENSLSLVQIMNTDTITLPTAYVLPYPAPNKLKQEILALDLPNDGFNKFTRSLASITQYDGMADFGDAWKNAKTTLNARYNHGFVSGGNLLNAAAWDKLIRSIKEKE